MKKQKKKEGRKGNRGRGGAAPAKNLIFEHFYDALSPFDPRNRILSTRTLRSSIFRAIRASDPDFQIQQNQGKFEAFKNLVPQKVQGKVQDGLKRATQQ